MKLLVQKFGGTSVATKESRAKVLEKIREAKKEGWSVAAVVSAMGRKGEPYATDSLLELFSGGNPLPCSREQDALYVCGEMIAGALIANELQKGGDKSVFLNGGQAGIITNAKYSEADILDIRKEAVLSWLEKGYTVIIAGGQGITEQGDFTSIGRGGGDTTACAMGYYLNADEVRIYTDVDGIYTGDPRIIKNAYPISDIGYEQCMRLAGYGAKVIHPKAVAYSRMGGKNVLSVRSTFTENPGTRIGDFKDSSIGVTALRNRTYFKCGASEEGNLRPYLERAETVLEDGGFLYGILGAGKADLSGLPCEKKVRDVIFAIGPDACRKLKNSGFERSLAEEICSLDKDCAAVFVKSEHYERLINQIHDKLCILNADEIKER